MNKHIFTEEVQGFIQKKLKSDLNALILKGSPFEDISIQELAQQIEGKQKAEKKLPLWFQTKNIFYAKKLNLEQTSSEATALYKAKLVSGNNLIDLTGGFGIDCTYFSKNIQEVHHCEMNEELSKIVSHNLQQLAIQNIQTHIGDSLETLKNLNKKFDWIYIDPSRRNDAKGKVFLLKDCLPNLPKNIDFLFSFSNNILIKNSPILDISSTINELKYVKEIHVVAVTNEVKELLFILEKEYSGSISIKTSNLLKDSTQNFDYIFEDPSQATYDVPKSYLYEPNAAILKSGAFQQISSTLHLDKLHQHSHLYTSDKLKENFPGRIFKIEEVIAYDKKKIAKLLPNKKANITIRNFPETVAQIRKKTKIKEGGNIFLFFTTDLNNKKIVLYCSKI